MSNYTIANGCNIPLNVQTGSIPSMGVALLDWFQYMTFTKVVKTILDYQVVETSTDINFWGILQPDAGRRLEIKDIGERKWNYVKLTAQDAPNGALLSLQPDEVITYQGTQYRVMASRNYSLYGYIEMDLVEDYTQSGPTPGGDS